MLRKSKTLELGPSDVIPLEPLNPIPLPQTPDLKLKLKVVAIDPTRKDDHAFTFVWSQL